MHRHRPLAAELGSVNETMDVLCDCQTEPKPDGVDRRSGGAVAESISRDL